MAGCSPNEFLVICATRLWQLRRYIPPPIVRATVFRFKNKLLSFALLNRKAHEIGFSKQLDRWVIKYDQWPIIT